jgi:hypothetical protein
LDELINSIENPLNVPHTPFTKGKKNILVALLQLLFPKWLQILNNHIFLCDLTAKYLRRVKISLFISLAQEESPKNGSNKKEKADVRQYSVTLYTIDNIWGVMQLEIESLIRSHLHYEATEEQRKVKTKVVNTTTPGKPKVQLLCGIFTFLDVQFQFC